MNFFLKIKIILGKLEVTYRILKIMINGYQNTNK